MKAKPTAEQAKNRREAPSALVVMAMAMAMAIALAWWTASGPLLAQAPGDLHLEPFTFTAQDGTRIEAERGTFFVLENRDKPDSAVISLALVRLPSTSFSLGPPIFFLAGGPGGSGIETMQSGVLPMANVMREFGDVIALDQRGVGESEPNLRCPKRNDLLIPADEPLDPDAVLDQLRKKSKRCARKLRKRGVDLDAYNTVQSADDLDELRGALGADRMILWGESYGTHLSLAAIRKHGEHVAKAVLFGSEGPNHTVKLPRNVEKNLNALASEIRNDPVVGPALPDLVGTLEGLIAELTLNPQTLDTVDPETGRELRITLGGEDLKLLFAQEIADDHFFPLIPRLLVQAESGDYSLLAQLLASLREPIPLAAMTFAMDCASGSTKKRWRKVRRQAKKATLGRQTDYPFPDVCEAWGVPDLGNDFRSGIESEVRTLFVSGTLDGRTPVSNATEIARGMTDSEHLVIEGAGHEFVLRPDPRVLEALRDFLADRPVTTHRISILPLRFDPI